MRGEGRAREMRHPARAGATAASLLRQMLTETLVLFLLGAAVGLLVARVSIQAALTGSFAIGRTAIELDVHYDWSARRVRGRRRSGGRPRHRPVAGAAGLAHRPASSDEGRRFARGWIAKRRESPAASW